MNYLETLSSTRWRVLKWRTLVRADFCCQRCGRKYHGRRPGAMRHFNLHHKHYQTVGRETFDDVLVLCRPCHQVEHGLESEGAAPK